MTWRSVWSACGVRRLRAGSSQIAGALTVIAGLAVTFGADGFRTAEAAPSVWAKVHDPDLERRHRLAAEVDSLLVKYAAQLNLERAGHAVGLAPVYLHEARKLLEEGRAAESTDMQLRFRLAEVLEELREYGKAAAILESIVRANPAAPHREEAWRSLAICDARLGRHDEELKAYAEALALQPHSSGRALILANRAEAYMALGRLSEAIEGYRQALSAISATPIEMITSGVTSLWGLAVASDRNGDLEAALQAITLARTYDPRDVRIFHSSNWFFVPPYDEAWYAALGHWVTARRTDLGDERKENAYDDAIAAWEDYLARARETDHWLPIARARLQACEKERAAAIKKARQKPPAKEAADEETAWGVPLTPARPVPLPPAPAKKSPRKGRPSGTSPGTMFQ
jgi:tetratricopeptide (TPR) repeat protein